MNFKKFISGVSALAIAATTFVGMAVTANAATLDATLEHTASNYCGAVADPYNATVGPSSNRVNVWVTNTVDAEKEHYQNEGSGTYQGYAFADFSYSIPDGATLVKATLTWTAAVSDGSNREHKIYYLNAGSRPNYASFQTTGTSLSRYNGSKSSTIYDQWWSGEKTEETDVTTAVADRADQGYIVFQWTQSAKGADLYGKGSTKAPTLSIEYTTASLYTANFVISGTDVVPDVTVYTDEGRTSTIGADKLTPGTTYYYTATKAGYTSDSGSFTKTSDDLVNDACTIECNMTARTPVTSIKVNYNYTFDGDSEPTTLYTDNIDVAGRYVGDTMTVPFRAYIQYGGKLYQTSNNDSTYFGDENIALTAETVINKPLKNVDLGNGNIVYFKDFDDSTADNAYSRGSYMSAYANKSYTSTENLPAGKYNFIIRGYNRGRGSYVKVGDNTVFAATAFGNNGWSGTTVKDVNVPVAGNLSFVAGSSNTIDLYDIIIAVRTGDCDEPTESKNVLFDDVEIETLLDKTLTVTINYKDNSQTKSKALSELKNLAEASDDVTFPEFSGTGSVQLGLIITGVPESATVTSAVIE